MSESPRTSKHRLAVVTPLFSIAGVPLAQLRFARALAARGHHVDLLIGHVEAGYKLPEVPGVNVRVLNTQRVREMLGPVREYLREANPAAVFSAEDHLNAVVLLAAITSGSSAKFSCSSRVTPYDTYSKRPLSKRWVLKQFMRTVMWRADVLTCVSEDMVTQYRSVFESPRHVCVYNIVDDAASRAKMSEAVDHPWLNKKDLPVIVAAGRLAPWKGFLDLLVAWKELIRQRQARLIILGDGPQRPELEATIGRLGLQDSVRLEGYVENPLKYFARADVFVLSSHVEGLPNVLVEAMMCGCTPVSTDCPTGPREVLASGKYGYLVPMRDPNALARGIEQALDRPIDRKDLQQAVAPFSEDRVIARHFDLLSLPRRRLGDV